MAGHGDHWETICDVKEYTRGQLVEDIEAGELLGRWARADVVNGTDRAEQVSCLRCDGVGLGHQILLVSDSRAGNNELFSAYPVALDGIHHRITVDRVEPWEYGIEGWIHGRVTAEKVPFAFFDTDYFAGSAEVEPGDNVDVRLAALAYWLRPIRSRTFEIGEGAMWETARQRRLDDGESVEAAERPVTIHMTGAAIFLPRGEDAPDDAQFQGVIDALTSFMHHGQRIYRLEIAVMRPGDEDFCLPIYAAERVLDGYVPKLGDDVEGLIWLQGHLDRPSCQRTDAGSGATS